MHSLIPQFIATLGATFGAFSLGNVIAWPSTALQESQIPEEFNIDMDSTTYSMIVSIFMIGAAVVPWIGCKYCYYRIIVDCLSFG